MGCAVSKPLVEGDLSNTAVGTRGKVNAQNAVSQSQPSHQLHEQKLVKVVGVIRPREETRDDAIKDNQGQLYNKRETFGKQKPSGNITAEDFKDAATRRGLLRVSTEAEALAANDSVDKSSSGKGNMEGMNAESPSLQIPMQRTSSSTFRPGDKSFMVNLNHKNTSEATEGNALTHEELVKREILNLEAARSEDINIRQVPGKDMKPKGDAKVDPSGNMLSKFKQGTKEPAYKPRALRNGNGGGGGGMLKAIGLTGASSNNAPAEDEKPAVKASNRRIEISAFEIANIIVRLLNLRNSLRSEDIEELKREILDSEGVRKLVTNDDIDLQCIAAEDKRMELRKVARQVAQLGAFCQDPAYKCLVHDFNMLGTVEEPKPKWSEVEVEQALKELETQAQVTAELYHELIRLKSLEQTYQKKAGEEKPNEKDEKKGAATKKLPDDVTVSLKNEVKAQERSVKHLKKKSLWNRRLDTVVEKLVEVVMYLHKLIITVFDGPDGNITPRKKVAVVRVGGLMDSPRESASDLQKLGVSGLALHYANIIHIIDNLAMRPFIANQTRDHLYQMLSPSLRRQLKKALMKSKDMEQESTDMISEHMESVLDWLVTMGTNTIRYSAEMRLQGHTDLTLLQTLHHARLNNTDELLVDLLVRLNHIASRNRRHGDPEISPIPHAPIIAPIPEERESGSGGSEGEGGGEEEKEKEEDVSMTTEGVVGGTVRGFPPGRLADLTSSERREGGEDDEDDDGDDDTDDGDDVHNDDGDVDNENDVEKRTSKESGAADFEREMQEAELLFKSTEKTVFSVPLSPSVPPKASIFDRKGAATRVLSLNVDSSNADVSTKESQDGMDAPQPSASEQVSPMEWNASGVPPRARPSVVALRKLSESLSEEERAKIERLANAGTGIPPGISMSQDFHRRGAAGLSSGALGGRNFSTSTINKPSVGNGGAFKPRSQSFSYSRSLSRSNSNISFGQDKSPLSRFRAMTPRAIDVDALGESEPVDA